MSNQSITYVVGAEKRLAEIICEAEIVPLLKGTVKAGALEATLTDAEGNALWSCKSPAGEGIIAGAMPVCLEGEMVGKLVVKGERCQEELLKGIAGLLMDAVNTIVTNNLKRMLTTEIHTAVVNQSYEELLETNRKLTVSEGRYRELAETLEKKVEERTGELKQAHTQLLRQEKMASVGQLAAGVAHEINNPLGFITSNLGTLQKYVARFVVMLDFYRSSLKSGAPIAEVAGQVEEKWRELKLDAVFADIGDLLAQSLEGAERVKRIVADLKGFSHIDDSAEDTVDINREIDRTLSVLGSQIPPGTEVVKEYQPLPGFVCNPALLCQAFLNIIQNALQARKDGLRLVVSTACSNGAITISFRDNGPGIPADIRNRIFEPFYTTREVGAGTGMGLAVVYDIVSGCGGTVEVECPADEGSIFTISLPLKR
ncbi:MAG: hypothetical protein FD174_1779 [Geobacteraceae bacterium]|nr:MAG: hypothetical protein FD174_1779 [Geobacteraceae bacterium]